MAADFTYDGSKIVVCNGTSGTPLTFADMHDADVGGGWGVVTEVVENAMYKIDCDVDFGDGVIETHFVSPREAVHFTDGKNIRVLNNANVTIGAAYGDWTEQGSYWSLGPSGAMYLLPSGDAGILKVLSSHLHNRGLGRVTFAAGTLVVKRSRLSALWGVIDTNYTRRFDFYGGTIDLDDVILENVNCLFLAVMPNLIRDIRVHRCSNGVECQAAGVVASGLRLTSFDWYDVITATSGVARSITLVDPITPISGTSHAGSEASWSKEAYTCNVHLADVDGADLSGVTVLCEDQFGAEVFSVNTDANGDIAEQAITYKRWLGTSETLTIYSPHKFTFSKAEYPTVVYDAVTVDSPINWHIEFLAGKRRPRMVMHV